MSSTMGWRSWGGLLFALAVFALPAGAQETATVDLGAGYQYLRAPDDQSYPLGANVDVSGALFGGLRWVGEVGVSRDRERDDEFGVTATLMAVNYGGGLRFAPGRGRWPYAQVVVGRHRDSFTVNADDIGDVITESRSTLMVQPGAGLAFNVGRWRLFGQVDYRRIFYEENEENDLRFVVGTRVTLK